MTEFVTLPSANIPGRAERLDPFAVKRIADRGLEECTAHGVGFETGVHIALSAAEVERIVTSARTDGRASHVKHVPERTFPHPGPRFPIHGR